MLKKSPWCRVVNLHALKIKSTLRFLGSLVFLNFQPKSHKNHDKLLTGTCCDEAGGYVEPDVLSKGSSL